MEEKKYKEMLESLETILKNADFTNPYYNQKKYAFLTFVEFIKNGASVDVGPLLENMVTFKVTMR